jgi:hypothetical protein
VKTRTVTVEGKTFQVHELKSWPRFYRPVDARLKTYEVRRDDRGFKVGDRLWLREWDPDEKEYTGDSLVAQITHILTAHEGLTKGFVCMAITVL